MTAPPRDGSALCASCGLCCDGTLFDRAPLATEDVATARRLHLPVYQEGDRPGFHLPCPRQQDDRRCGVYDERPGICRSFACDTLAAFLAEEVDLPAASALVERLRGIAARVRTGLPAHLQGYALWPATQRFAEEGEQAPDPAAWRARHGDALFDILELERWVRRHFVTRPR